jgi:hypothetical protein
MTNRRTRRLLFESLEPRRLLASNIALQQHPLDSVDVNNDARISPHDALRVIDYLNSPPVNAATIGSFHDVTGDRQITTADALEVINRLNGGSDVRRRMYTEIRDAGAGSYQPPGTASNDHRSFFNQLGQNWNQFETDAAEIRDKLNEVTELPLANPAAIIDKLNEINVAVETAEERIVNALSSQNVAYRDVLEVMKGERALAELAERTVGAYSFRGVAASHADFSYGSHERNVFDIWLAESSSPTPVVLMIHGGGFVAGDKSAYHQQPLIDEFLNKGVSVAVINYRFQTNPDLNRPFNENDVTVLDSIHDSMRALQTIRHYAEQWNVDPDQIASFGSSAGSGTSMYLAFHDDQADLESEDPVARQSTRLTAVGALNCQFTYDIRKWPASLGIPQAWADDQLVHLKEDEFQILDELDFHDMMSADDPPLYVYQPHPNSDPPDLNLQDTNPGSLKNHIQHHPNFGVELKQRAELVGIPGSHTIIGHDIVPDDGEYERLIDFLLASFA